jgi:hypothetical protein
LLLTHLWDSHSASFLIQCCKLKEVCDGWSDKDAGGLYWGGFAPFGATMQRCGSGSALAVAGGDPRWR